MSQLAFDLWPTPPAPIIEPADPPSVVEYASVEPSSDALFDIAPDWSQPHTIRRVSFETALRWVQRYHYLCTVASHAQPYGWFGPDMKSLVIFGQPSNAHGVAAKYDLLRFPGNIEIVRVATHPDAPTNSTSECVAAALRAFYGDTGLLWVFSYADTGQGHHGGIYQALNAIYVGVSAARPGYLLNGEPIHPRTVVSRFGTQGVDAPRRARLAGAELVKVDDLNAAKHTYILPIGPPATRRAIRKTLRPHTKPYPKRASEESTVIRPPPRWEGPVQSRHDASGTVSLRDVVVPL